MSDERLTILNRIRQHQFFGVLRGQSLRALALKGSLWTLIGFVGAKFFQVTSNLILTRLLFPEAFGLMALVNVIIVGLTMFSDVGIRPAIVQNLKGEDLAFLNTAWTVQTLRGFALWAVTCLVAWPVSRLYGQPTLFPLLCVVGSTAAINGFQSFALATASRRLQLGRLTLVQLGGQITQIAITVILAWMYDSVWALASGNVIGAIAQTLLSHVAWPSQGHMVRLDQESLNSLLHFGRWIFLATLVTFLGGQGLQLIQGALVPPKTLGMLYIATMFSWSLRDLSSQLYRSVVFPILSKTFREDAQRVKSQMERSRLYLLALIVPSLIVLSFSSNFLISTLYDVRYAAAGPYLAISAITAAIGILPMAYQNALLACGDSRAHFIIVSAGVTFRIAGLLIGFRFGGVVGMLLGIGVGSLMHFLGSAAYARKMGWQSPLTDLASIGVILIGAYASFTWQAGVW
jgi:O-antigen/teichoic acid export membrane protein